MVRIYAISNRFQYYSDKLKPQFRPRWISTFVLACFYAIRFYLHGYYVVTFFLGVLLSSFTILFLSSIIHHDKPVSPEAPPILPIKATDQLRPFVPFLNEFTFWIIVNTKLCVASSLTFIPKLNLDMPVYPYGYILFGGWIFFTLMLVLDQLDSMKKYKCIPFYYGDKKRGNTKGNDLLLVETRSGGMELDSAFEHAD
ncbi:hypothetical protein CASFOL_020565 [Castilleja foliolosa]|uniref:Uncharacterized protein n=1 Tax=Castilleja foliolosa TaxID=1961234 RepID=A0ABD3D1Y9_9LAMI